VGLFSVDPLLISPPLVVGIVEEIEPPVGTTVELREERMTRPSMEIMEETMGTRREVQLSKTRLRRRWESRSGSSRERTARRTSRLTSTSSKATSIFRWEHHRELQEP